MSGKTILTEDWPPEIQKKIDDEKIKNDRRWYIALYICERTVEAYLEGQITSAVALDYIVNSLKKPKADLDRIPAIYRAFYHDKLVELPEKKRSLKSGRLDPKWIKKFSLNLISRSQKDGFTVKREDVNSKTSAFHKVEELLKDAGIKIPASTILSWYSSNKKQMQKKKIIKKTR